MNPSNRQDKSKLFTNLREMYREQKDKQNNDQGAPERNQFQEEDEEEVKTPKRMSEMFDEERDRVDENLNAGYEESKDPSVAGKGLT
jgi:hypothetical protein